MTDNEIKALAAQIARDLFTCGKGKDGEAMNAYMTDEAIEELEETWRLRREAVRLLGLIVAEWQSDPQSVQCFDLRIVEAATKTVKRMEQLKHVDVV